MNPWCKVLPLIALLSAACVQAATNPFVAAVPVPSSPYLPRMYKYVDALLEDPASKTNLHEHQNWLRVLYTLSELSTKPKYRDAADAAMRRWLEEVPGANQPIRRPWLLWDRCFQIAPELSQQFVLAVLKNQITNHPGFYMRACAAAYQHTKNATFLRAIEDFAPRPSPTLSFAIDCDGAARVLPEPVALRLRALAEQTDNQLAALSREAVAEPQRAMLYVSRYENTGKVAYREAIHAAANENLKAPPDGSPAALGHAISLQLAAWRSTARQAHLDKARGFADFALSKHFEGGSELIPGNDTLALSLVELHLHILYITAVRYPPNTLDR
jgi:hypothetical protein